MLVQARNPVTDRWVKIDTFTASIVAHKKSPGPYKGVQIVGKPLKVNFLSKDGKIKLRRRWGEKPPGERRPVRVNFLARR